MQRNRFLLLITILALAWGILPVFADGTNTPTDLPSDADDFAPGLFIVAVFMMAIMVIVFALLLGFGLVVGVVVCALTGALVAFGILSASTAIEFIRRSPASGFRALFLQLGAVAGIPCGIVGAWLVSSLAHSHWSLTTRFLVGATAGLVCGVLAAWLLNTVWGKFGTWMLTRYEHRHQKERKMEAIDA